MKLKITIKQESMIKFDSEDFEQFELDFIDQFCEDDSYNAFGDENNELMMTFETERSISDIIKYFIQVGLNNDDAIIYVQDSRKTYIELGYI